MSNPPLVRYYTLTEGGPWIPFKSGEHTAGNVFHAIILEDGTIYDAYNGLRKRDPDTLRRLDAIYTRDYKHASPLYFVPTEKGDAPLTMDEVVNTVLEKLELVLRHISVESGYQCHDRIATGIAKLLKERRHDSTKD